MEMLLETYAEVGAMTAMGRQRVSVHDGQMRVYSDNPGRNRRHDGP
jgi:hypothetical protein